MPFVCYFPKKERRRISLYCTKNAFVLRVLQLLHHITSFTDCEQFLYPRGFGDIALGEGTLLESGVLEGRQSHLLEWTHNLKNFLYVRTAVCYRRESHSVEEEDVKKQCSRFCSPGNLFKALNPVCLWLPFRFVSFASATVTT